MSLPTAVQWIAAVTPRIETAEILAFRLKVPPEALKRLRDQLSPELPLAIEHDGTEIILSMEEADSYLRFRSIGDQAMLTEIFLSMEEADSYLRFRSIGDQAMLTEIFLCNDEQGAFFQRVLGELMVRHAGDLQARLTWNTPERNSHGDYAEVRISRGSTTYPGLANGLGAIPPASGAEGVVMGGGDDGELEGLSPLEKEIQDLLLKARAHWEEYQRLKARRGRE